MSDNEYYVNYGEGLSLLHSELGARHQANGCEASGRASLACPDEGIRYVFFSVLKTGAEEGLQVGTEGAQSFQPLRCGFNDFLLGLKNLAAA